MNAAVDLPVELRRMWGLPNSSGLGRPAQLDVQRILRTAVRMADRHGLEGVSLPKIADALGYTTMSLYRYVGSKDELLSLMRDFAIGDPPAIEKPPDKWRSGLQQWASAELLLYYRHKWLPRLPIAPPAGPNAIAWMETALCILRRTGLNWPAKVGILTLISGYVRHVALLSQDLGRGRAGTRIAKAQAERRYGVYLAKLIDPHRFPETTRLFASGIFGDPGTQTGDDPATDPDFLFGLERILDGTAVAIAETAKLDKSRV